MRDYKRVACIGKSHRWEARRVEVRPRAPNVLMAFHQEVDEADTELPQMVSAN